MHRSKHGKSRWQTLVEAAPRAPELVWPHAASMRVYVLPIDPDGYDRLFVAFPLCANQVSHADLARSRHKTLCFGRPKRSCTEVANLLSLQVYLKNLELTARHVDAEQYNLRELHTKHER